MASAGASCLSRAVQAGWGGRDSRDCGQGTDLPVSTEGGRREASRQRPRQLRGQCRPVPGRPVPRTPDAGDLGVAAPSGRQALLCRQPQAASFSGGSRWRVSEDVPKAAAREGGLGRFMLSRAVCVSVARGGVLHSEPLQVPKHPMTQEGRRDSGRCRWDSRPHCASGCSRDPAANPADPPAAPPRPVSRAAPGSHGHRVTQRWGCWPPAPCGLSGLMCGSCLDVHHP